MRSRRVSSEARARLAGLESTAQALVALEALEPLLAEATASWQTATQARQDAVDHHQRLLQRHLDGIAAELAAHLVDGEPCAVCGSVAHPRPAAAGHAAVTAAEVERAQDARAAAEAAADDARSAHEARQRRRAELASLVGDADSATLLVDLGAARAEVDAAQRAELRVPALLAARDDLRARGRTLGSEATALAAEVARAGERLTAAQAALQSDSLTISEGRAGLGSVAERREGLRAEAGRARAAAEAVRALAAALHTVASARAAAEAAAADNGLGDLDDVRDAARARPEIDSLDEAVREWSSTRDRLARAVSDTRFAGLRLDPSDAGRLAERLRASAAVLGDATAAGASATSAYERAVEARARAATREEQLAKRRLDVTRAEERLEHVVTSTAAVVRLAGLARGMAGDLRMTLTTYVLRQWFERVVDAANLRLLTMSSGRYELQRVDEAESRRDRSGLSLLVLDRHSGDARSPRSLSGGETFYTSLSLALGLADVVRAEAGGVDLDTLFIDEGFGSLDPDTLDTVMGVIDELRQGGRAVGVVSHVAELKDRIPERLEIRRIEGRGSTTRVVA